MKKIFVFSIYPFSKGSSNGRAIGSLFELLNDEYSITQIYFKSDILNMIKCNYLFVPEANMIKFKKMKMYKSLFAESLSDNRESSINSKIKKTPLLMLIRNALWNLRLGAFSDLKQTIIKENPDFIFVQDCEVPALFKYLLKISKSIKAKLIFYTSENYAFKNFNYMNLKNEKCTLLYKIFKNKLQKYQKKYVENSSECIFLTETLRDEYAMNYNIKNSHVLLPPITSDSESYEITTNDILNISYCGNLSNGRFDTLLYFYEQINKMTQNFILTVCSRLTAEQKEIIKQKDKIKFLGYVPQEKVLDVFRTSNLILHIESFEHMHVVDCKHAFSSKIGICLSMLKPFLYFGPSENAEAKFILKNKCAFVVENRNELFDFLNMYLDNRVNLNELKINQIATLENYFSKEKTYNTLKEIFR